MQEIIHDERCGVQIDIKPEIIVITQFIGSERKSRIEYTEQTVEGIHWDLPDAEETEHMVYTISVEILCHLAETSFPPCKTIFVHLFPVVGGEAPVLTKYREIVWGSAGLTVHIEQTCIGPGINACARDADWNIAFDSHTFGMGVVANLRHLF